MKRSCSAWIGWLAISLTLSLAGCADRAAEPEIEVFRGHMIWGHEVRAFTACGSAETGWIIDRTEGRMRQLAESVSGQAYGEILVELRGYLDPSQRTGFGEDYDYYLVATEVIPLPDSVACQ